MTPLRHNLASLVSAANHLDAIEFPDASPADKLVAERIGDLALEAWQKLQEAEALAWRLTHGE